MQGWRDRHTHRHIGRQARRQAEREERERERERERQSVLFKIKKMTGWRIYGQGKTNWFRFLPTLRSDFDVHLYPMVYVCTAVCVFVCVYVRVYVCVYTYIHAYIHTYTLLLGIYRHVIGFPPFMTMILCWFPKLSYECFSVPAFLQKLCCCLCLCLLHACF